MTSARRASWYLGGIALLLAGAAGLVTVIATRGGFYLAVVNIPLLFAGYGVCRTLRGARASAAGVAATGALVAGYITTTPLRMPHYEGAPVSLDGGGVLLTAAFAVIAVLVLFGSPRRA